MKYINVIGMVRYASAIRAAPDGAGVDDVVTNRALLRDLLSALEEGRRAVDAGASAVLSKPVDEHALLAEIALQLKLAWIK